MKGFLTLALTLLVGLSREASQVYESTKRAPLNDIGSSKIPDRYMVILNSGCTIKDHWRAIGIDLSPTPDFKDWYLFSGYVANLASTSDHYDFHLSEADCRRRTLRRWISFVEIRTSHSSRPTVASKFVEAFPIALLRCSQRRSAADPSQVRMKRVMLPGILKTHPSSSSPARKNVTRPPPRAGRLRPRKERNGISRSSQLGTNYTRR